MAFLQLKNRKQPAKLLAWLAIFNLVISFGVVFYLQRFAYPKTILSLLLLSQGFLTFLFLRSFNDQLDATDSAASILVQIRKEKSELATEKQRTNAFTEKILELNHDCILMLDPEWKVAFINDRGVTLLEMDQKSELLSKPWLEFLPPSEQPAASQALSSAKDGKKSNFNLICPTVKGTMKWWSATIVPLGETAGQDFLLVIARDITEHTLAEKALRESEAAFRKVFEENSIGMLLIDLNFKITQANNALSGMLGYTHNELVGLDVRDLAPTSDALDAEGIENLLKGHVSNFHCEKLYLSKRKEQVWGHLTASLIHDSEGEPIYMIQMIENIDERKNSEKQLLAYQEQLQSLASELSLSEERERRRIANNLHDQIGQTLAFARLKLGTLRKSFIEESSTSTAVAEVQGLIEQAIVDTRSLTFELSPPVLYELGLVPAVEWLARKFQKEHAITTRFNDDGLAKPLDDNLRIVLFQAVRELLVNIIKHARASHVQVLIRRDADAIRIIIEDDGVGFDTATIHFHGDPNRGFGLFNVRERVEYLGGKVKFRSEHGHGTRVTLIAPLKLDHVTNENTNYPGR